MGITAMVLGILGAISAILGGLAAFDVMPDSMAKALDVDWTFWMYAAGILLLGCIAFLLGEKNNPRYDD